MVSASVMRPAQLAHRANNFGRGVYIKLKNKVNRTAESQYWKRLSEEKENRKDFWKTVKKMMGRENKVKRIGPIKNEKAELIYDDTEKTETMNRFFCISW